MPLVLVALALLLAGAATPARASDWARPVAGEIVEAFAYDRAAPFAVGQHRGIDLAARAGEAVRAPCPGVVTFAGRVPSRGVGVSIRCGALIATLVELRDVGVRRDSLVGRGDRVGRAAGVVHLGARRGGSAFGYVDPASLFGRRPPPLGPAPPVRRRPRPAPTLRPAPAPRPVAAPAVTPVGAWVGLGLVAAGLPLGAVARRRRERARGAVGGVVAPR
jgi:hypothetical protein